MSHQQSWPLAQEANKNSGTCSYCYAVASILKDGTVHVHGPHKQPCPGSRKLPLSDTPAYPLVTPTDSQTIPHTYIPVISSQLPSSNSTSQSLSFDHPSVNFPIIKHIPKSARPACCTALSRILHRISQSPDDLNAWSSLLGFGTCIFARPARGGKRHNLSAVIKKRADDVYHNTTVSSSPLTSFDHQPKLLKSNASASLAARVSSKIEDGNVKAAVRLICSEDNMAVKNQDNLSKLLDKHPSAPTGRQLVKIDCSTPQYHATEADVLKAIRSFPAGSSGGPDGIRPQHLLDLVNCTVSGSNVVAAITAFVNTLLDGNCHPEVRPVLFGGNLIALDKKCGGIRPIAIGYVWRRLAAKCANFFAATKLASYFSPLQLGVSVPGGCEAAVHSVRRFTDSLPSNKAIIKLDFANAFNSLHRDAMLSAVREKIPEIYQFCFLSYGSASSLKFGDYVIPSQEGAQQGDPLGPLLFSLTIQPLLQTLTSELVIGYLDDITLGDDELALSADVAQIQEQGEALGLKLNINKCEFISENIIPSASIFQDFVKLDLDNAMLLGAPLRPGRAMDVALTKRCDELSLAISRLVTLSSHDALVLLRASFSAPKVLYTLRSSPCVGHSCLSTFDSLQRSGLCLITNSNLSDTQWLQASLPVKDGGFGMRRVALLASPAFLASAASTRALQDLILSRCDASPDQSFSHMCIVYSLVLIS